MLPTITAIRPARQYMPCSGALRNCCGPKNLTKINLDCPGDGHHSAREKEMTEVFFLTELKPLDGGIVVGSSSIPQFNYPFYRRGFCYFLAAADSVYVSYSASLLRLYGTENDMKRLELFSHADRRQCSSLEHRNDRGRDSSHFFFCPSLLFSQFSTEHGGIALHTLTESQSATGPGHIFLM